MKKPRTYKVESLHDGSFEKNKLEHKIRRPFTTCIIALVDLGIDSLVGLSVIYFSSKTFAAVHRANCVEACFAVAGRYCRQKCPSFETVRKNADLQFKFTKTKHACCFQTRIQLPLQW